MNFWKWLGSGLMPQIMLRLIYFALLALPLDLFSRHRFETNSQNMSKETRFKSAGHQIHATQHRL
jgi:hypothetical protein